MTSQGLRLGPPTEPSGSVGADAASCPSEQAAAPAAPALCSDASEAAASFEPDERVQLDAAKLHCYQVALELHTHCSTLVALLNRIVKDQLERASLSVVLNIAEAGGRRSRRDKARSEDPQPLADRPLSELDAYPYVGSNPVNSTDPYGLQGFHGRNIHGNYCGPNNGGDPLTRVDDCCVVHDKCYDDAGLPWKATFSSQKKKLPPEKKQKCDDCDRQLCECLRKLLFANPSPTWYENDGMAKVDWYFKCSKYDKKK